MTEILVYQGYQRHLMLKYLHRLCIQRHRDALLDPACAGCAADAAPLDAQVATWCGLIVAELDGVIRDAIARAPGNPGDYQREGDAMALFYHEAGMVQVLAGMLEPLCAALRAGREGDCDAMLWRVLSQHFKRVMDQLDGLAGESGTHRLKTRRRIDRLRKELEAARGEPFASVAEAVAALCDAIAARGLSTLPAKASTVEDYLLELQADSQQVGEEDIDRDPLLLDLVATPDLLLLLEQCVGQLSPELREAVAIKQQWDGEPVFMRSEHMAAHYGFGWETVRKRSRAALQQLRDCLEV